MTSKMSNHEKTQFVESLGMSRNYNLFEQFLMSVGMGWVVSIGERIRFLNKVREAPGINASITGGGLIEEEFPLTSKGLDYD
ncbi:MAG: hypothetical protein E6P95_03125 [Candidatus Moraniibacteriota bacterium]|nr:MAG: hypothetical protein E6P95_03125 [Candidatus Moranbacteria bacterium]